MAITKLKKPLEGKLRYSKDLNDKLEEVIDLVNSTIVDGVVTQTSGTLLAAGVTEYTVLTTLTATEIVGTAVGDIGHAKGAILVPDNTSSYTYEFVSAVAIYDYNTAAYTGGADDIVIANGSTVYTGVCAKADLLGAAGDKIVYFSPLSTVALPMVVGDNISLRGTAFTNPGTAAGVLRVYTTYRKILTGL